MLENEIEGRLYKTVWLTGGKVSFSVSRINQHLSYYFIVFWLLVALYVGWRFLDSPEPDFFRNLLLWPGLRHPLRLCYVVLIILLIVAGVVLLLGQTSNLAGTLPNSDGSHSTLIVRRCWQKPRWWPKQLRWQKPRWLQNLRLRKHISGGKSQPLPLIRRYAPEEEPK